MVRILNAPIIVILAYSALAMQEKFGKDDILRKASETIATLDEEAIKVGGQRKRHLYAKAINPKVFSDLDIDYPSYNLCSKAHVDHSAIVPHGLRHQLVVAVAQWEGVHSPHHHPPPKYLLQSQPH